MIGEADRGGRALFPPSISEILPEEHIARFFVRVVEGLDLSKLKAEYSPNLGRTGYAPAVLLTLWIYGYVKGVSSSRKLEEATWLNLDFMYIANGEHPDHTTLSNFRKTTRTRSSVRRNRSFMWRWKPACWICTAWRWTARS